MAPPRILPLYDEAVQPSSWNERMSPGEIAVHFSRRAGAPGTAFTCTVLPSLAEAEAFAQAEVERTPDLRCRLYDAGGFAGAPLREIRGSAFRGDSEISSRFRRWVGGSLLLVGVVLVLFDALADYTHLWPSMLGFRLLPAGLLLLCTEAVLVWQAKHKRTPRGSA